MSTVTCEFCKRSIDPHEAGVHQYTTGWVKNREGGGGHGISLPTRLPRWACFGCMDRKLKGTYGQTSLLDAPVNMPTETPDVSWPKPTNAGFEGEMLVHVCNVCGQHAPYGIGVAIRTGDLGLWYCAEHRPMTTIGGEVLP